MLAQQRQALIVREVRRAGAVRVTDLVSQLGVSDMTIRRDLDALANRGLLRKVHGGATSATVDRSTEEPGFEAKSVRQLAEKEAIAVRAASCVTPGSAVALSAGTTTWTLARRLADIPELTLITNSLRVADALQRVSRPDQTVVLTGGVRTPSDALVGPVAIQAIRSLHPDVLFLGVHGMAEQSGFTTPNLDEGETNRALAAAAHRRIVIADHTKWGVIGLATIAPLNEADVVITDDGLPQEAADVLGEQVGELVIVPVTGHDGEPEDES